MSKSEQEIELLEEQEIYMEMDMLKRHSHEISDCMSVHLGTCMLHSLHQLYFCKINEQWLSMST